VYFKVLLPNILFNLDNSIIELVEWVNKTLDWQAVDLHKMKYIIDGILYAERQINKFEKVIFRTEQQQLLVNNDIISMLQKYNDKILWQIDFINRGLFLQNWTIPEWMSIANTIKANNYIKSITNLKFELIEEK
jgi:hypothetical protein